MEISIIISKGFSIRGHSTLTPEAIQKELIAWVQKYHEVEGFYLSTGEELEIKPVYFEVNT